MKDAPAFEFYPERWLVGVAEFSDAEQLAFLRLLCHQWTADGLPADMKALKRLAGRGVTESILAKFPVCEDGKRRNSRLEKIRGEQRARIAKSRGAASARWGGGHRLSIDQASSEHDSGMTQASSEHDSGMTQASSEHRSSMGSGITSLLSPVPSVRHIHKPDVPGEVLPPCSENDAWAYAQSAGIAMTREGVTLWHSVNERNGWTIARSNGAMVPILDWRAALRSSVPWVAAELSKSKSNDNNRRTNRQPAIVTRNTAPLPANRPSLNDTAV